MGCFIFHSIFNGYNSTYGGAIELDNTDSYAFVISLANLVDIKFTNNLGALGGAIYQRGNRSLFLKDSLFLRNRATIGGAILKDCEFFAGCKVNITNSTMKSNFAELSPVLTSKSLSLVASECSVENNSDSISFAANDISTFPLRVIVLGEIKI